VSNANERDKNVPEKQVLADSSAESFQSVQIALSLCGLCASARNFFFCCGFAALGELVVKKTGRTELQNGSSVCFSFHGRAFHGIFFPCQ
jgi:hypothetical protein